MDFYLGTHEPSWLGRSEVPLMISRRRLDRRQSWPRARSKWVLDSSGFSELLLHGRWTITPRAYVASVRRWREDIGRLQWAAAMDWMCEPAVRLKTGLSVREHQIRTVANYKRLQDIGPDLPWLPVIQGWTLDEYRRHVDMYDSAGVVLARAGLGSVCRRQGTREVLAIVRALAGYGIGLHAFGVKTLGLRLFGGLIRSADSLAWSFRARLNPPLPGCVHSRCSNCFLFAMDWRARLKIAA